MKKIGLRKLFPRLPVESKKICPGTKPYSTRRGFIRNVSLTAIQLAIGTHMVHANNFPKGLLPIDLANTLQDVGIPGKHPGLIVLNDRPINAETPPHLLDPDITPRDVFFVRNNGLPPDRSEIHLNEWTLTVEGESALSKKTYSLAQLKSGFKNVDLHLTLECGGNGRSEFNPPAKGNQWTTGAVGCAKWTGVRLKDVLNDVGIKSNAVYIGYYGADRHLSGDPSKDAISRGVPINKALQDESMIAWAMNDEDLPLHNGYPLRLVFGGWPASCSGKWLNKIVIRNKVHDGEKMDGSSYKVPCSPVAPGSDVADDDMCIIESMPVKSLITSPESGAMIKTGSDFTIRGHAWAGEREVREVHYSTDFGSVWKSCVLTRPVNRFAWQHFNATINLKEKGYYEVWARAIDEDGFSQPMLVPGWNPKGYLNNACHRIAVKII